MNKLTVNVLVSATSITLQLFDAVAEKAKIVKPVMLYLYNKRRYVCLFVCLSVCIYVPYGRPNGWADRDQT